MKMNATGLGPFDQCPMANVLRLCFKLTADLEQDAFVYTTEYQSSDRNLGSAHSEYQRLIIRSETDTEICGGRWHWVWVRWREHVLGFVMGSCVYICLIQCVIRGESGTGLRGQGSLLSPLFMTLGTEHYNFLGLKALEKIHSDVWRRVVHFWSWQAAFRRRTFQVSHFAVHFSGYSSSSK